MKRKAKAGWWNEGDEVAGLPEHLGSGSTFDVSSDEPDEKGLWLPNGTWHAIRVEQRRMGFLP